MFIKYIYAHARTKPKQVAIVWNGHPVSYLRFAQVVESLRTKWAPLALPRGSIAVVVVLSTIESWSAVLALQSLGLVTVCVQSLKEASQLGLSDISCTVMCSTKADKNRDVMADWTGVKNLAIPPDLYVQPVGKELPFIDDLPDAGGHILCTSGTTGTYKKIFHDSTLDAARCAKRVSAEEIDARTVCNTINLGLWTGLGYRRPLAVWYASGCMVFDQRPDWAMHLGEHGVTDITMITSKLADALKALGSDHARDLGWAFRLNIGGGFLTAKQAQLTLAHLTSNLSVIFGATEAWISPMKKKVEDLDDLHWLAPWQNREIEIVTEQGKVCPDGVEGLLRVKLNSLDYTEYMNDPVSTAKTFRDGWFYPGDLAVKRSNGDIRVLGRAADVINIGGQKIATAPIEDDIQRILGVSAVCVFSGLDQGVEDRLVLALETSKPINAKRLEAAASKFPGGSQVRFVQLREFPRTETGTQKVNRIALRKMLMTAPKKEVRKAEAGP